MKCKQVNRRVKMVNLKTKKIVSAMLLATLINISGVTLNFNSHKVNAEQIQFKPLQGSVVYVPSGTVFPATATMEISSENLTLGQNVCVAISQNFYHNNNLIAPIGSSVNGTVVHVKNAGHAGTNGQIMVKFTNIVTPYGQMIPISAKIQTDDGTGVLKGGTKMDSAADYAKDIAVGTAAGAVAGVIMGPVSGGKAGKGAVYGTAIGAGLGLAKSLWDKGEPARIPVGTVINIELDQQITYTPQQSYQY